MWYLRSLIPNVTLWENFLAEARSPQEILKSKISDSTTINHDFIEEFYGRQDDEHSIRLDSVLYWLELDRKQFLCNLKGEVA